MEEPREYQVNLEVFQGPLDLLLFLIRKKKINIHDIPISTITREYLDYLDRKGRINLEREGEFLLVAALLIYIKSQMLLPRERLSEEEEDPRNVLVSRLLDYQKIKAASKLLKEKEDEQMRLWQRTALPPLQSKDEGNLSEVSLFDLAEAFLTLMKKKEQENFRLISGKDVSLEEKIKELIDLLEDKKSLDFLEYFYCQESMEAALVSFFCLLELIKTGIVVAVQKSLFDSIQVWLRQEISS
jgi:segregation and condensation protein A